MTPTPRPVSSTTCHGIALTQDGLEKIVLNRHLQSRTPLAAGTTFTRIGKHPVAVSRTETTTVFTLLGTPCLPVEVRNQQGNGFIITAGNGIQLLKQGRPHGPVHLQG